MLSYDDCAIDGCTNKRQTPLHLAVLHGKRDVVKLLLDYGADVDAEVGFEGKEVRRRGLGRTCV